MAVLASAAYVVLASGAWLHGAVAGDAEWDALRIAFFAVWLFCAAGLLLRRRVALVVLLVIESWTLAGWLVAPGDWGLFAVQVVLVLLLVSTQRTFGRRHPRPT